MNGRPTQIVVALGISKRFTVEQIEELFAGMRLACEVYGVDLVGGDTTASYTGLTISVTCLGVADKKDIVYRNGAKVNDLICCTGNLGAAYLGLQLLERERLVAEVSPEEAQKAFEGKEYLLERHKPSVGKPVFPRCFPEVPPCASRQTSPPCWRARSFSPSSPVPPPPRRARTRGCPSR